MKRLKLIVASTLLAVGLSSVTGAWAKPGNGKGNQGNSNHGQTVSQTARSKSDGDTNHGKTVSEVARNKNKNKGKNNNKGKNKTKDRDDRDDSEDGDTRSDTIREAARTRDEAIRAAQRRYQQRRADIVATDDDGNLTREQRRQLEDAKEDRDRAIRQAQERYRMTVRRLS